MARPLRIEYAGALYHVTSRGNARADIYFDDADRRQFLALLDDTCAEFHWMCHSYCLMSNHYHLLVETGRPTLSSGMRFLNGTYAQRFNKRHQRVGHLLQGRYKAILVDSEPYLLELARYIVLNPVRAGMVHAAEEWPWSSYRATVGLCAAESCLTRDTTLARFSDRRDKAQSAYTRFVAAGLRQPSPMKALKKTRYTWGRMRLSAPARKKSGPSNPWRIFPRYKNWRLLHRWSL
ncbi:MAG: transposase [Pseudomonadota bacterium]